jgi:hypothetical protein
MNFSFLAGEMEFGVFAIEGSHAESTTTLPSARANRANACRPSAHPDSQTNSTSCTDPISNSYSGAVLVRQPWGNILCNGHVAVFNTATMQIVKAIPAGQDTRRHCHAPDRSSGASSDALNPSPLEDCCPPGLS